MYENNKTIFFIIFTYLALYSILHYDWNSQESKSRVGRYIDSTDSNIELKEKEYSLPMESLMILSLRFETIEY